MINKLKITKRNLFFSGVCVLVLASIFTFFLFVYNEYTDDNSNTNETVQESLSDLLLASYPISYVKADNNYDTFNETTDNKLFYEKDNNIYSLDVVLKKEIQWTNYPKNPGYSPAYDDNGNQIPSISFRKINIIDKNSIGFGMCATISGDYGCGLYTLQLSNKSIIEKIHLSSNTYIVDIGFYSPEKFAYLTVRSDQSSKQSYWEFIFSDEESIRTLLSFPINAYGRGSFVEDSQEIRFSENGRYVLQIATSSPLKAFDSNVYIYNLTDFSTEVIENATQPRWLNNNTIVYRHYKNIASYMDNTEGGRLYIYNINTHSSQKIDAIAKGAYHPVVLDENKILYSVVEDRTLWIYDFQKKEIKEVLESAYRGAWISENLIAYISIINCEGRENCGGPGGDYENNDIEILNLNSLTSSKTGLMGQRVYDFITRFN
jgi:hypothetical protein